MAINKKLRKTAVFFIYKFKIRGCRFYYIGVTSSIDSRRNAHIADIASCIWHMRNRRKLEKRHLKVLKIAQYFRSHKHFMKIDYIYIADRINFSILSIVDTPEEASQIEANLLKKHHGHPNCLNQANKSTYSKKIEHTKSKPSKIS